MQVFVPETLGGSERSPGADRMGVEPRRMAMVRRVVMVHARLLVPFRASAL